MCAFFCQTFGAWGHTDWIQFMEALGTWLLGLLGAYFVFHQNKILKRQNEIMVSQQGFNEALLEREQVIIWCKNAFRHHGRSPGELQTTGSTLRRRYPSQLVLRAYEELKNQEPALNLPPVYEFLQLMWNLGEDERKHWPTPGDYFTAPRV